MIARLFRAFFWAVLTASVAVYLYLGIVTVSAREAVLIEDTFSGFDPEVIGPGEVRFVPARALPGRVRLHRVVLGPRILTLRFRGGLRESEVLGLDETFFVHLHLRLNYRLETGRLTHLFRQLDQGDWKKLNSLVSKKLNYVLRRKMAEFYGNDGDLPGLEQKFITYLNGPLLAELNTAFQADGIVFRGLLVERVYVPDAARYRAMTAAGREILDQKVNRIKIIDTARANEESQRITDRAYFARLEKMGKLLRRHPHLREYLAVDQLGKNVEVLVMPSERWFGQSGPPAAALQSAPQQSRRPPAVEEFPQPGVPQTRAPRRRARDFIDLTPP